MIERHETRLGIVADIHGNLQALETVLAHLEATGVEAIYCLGDVVGYGGDPSACVAIVRERCAGTVRGNHDHAVVDPALRSWFNDHARRAIERQSEILGEDEIAWLATLPAVIELDEVTLGHSGFADPGAYTYVTGVPAAAVELAVLETRWGFIGHTHVPAAWRREQGGEIMALALGGPVLPGSIGEFRAARSTAIPLQEPGRYLINPGAVGQPRDRDPRASCAILDLGTETLHHARLPYDIAGAQDAIFRRGLPIFEAGRLAQGM